MNTKKIKSILAPWINNIRYKRTYIRYAIKMIRCLVDKGDTDNAILHSIREEYIRCTVPEIYKGVDDPELLRCIDYVEKNGPAMFCYDEAAKSYYDLKDVHFDEVVGLYYGFWAGKRLYFKKSINSAEAVRGYLSNSLWEQSNESPHRYLTNEFDVSAGDVVLDVGGAEGNFALTVIDKVSKVYIFECDDEWIEALNYTFADYKDRVVIVKKYVNDKDSDNTITIDTIINEYGLDRIHMIKMDIEGAEISAIKGASQSIREKRIEKWAVCTYHNPKDAERISQLLCDYKQEFSRGYIMSAVWRLHGLRYPYWVKGVLRARLDEER